MNGADANSTSMIDLIRAETWVFDLDNTLYPASSRLFDQVDWRMTHFIAEYLDVDPVAARKVQKTYFREHGTTMRGLMDRHGLDPKIFLDFVHDIDLSPISPCPVLAQSLDRLPGRKIIFTNGSVGHADRITRHLGIHHHFEGVFDIVQSDYVPKPAAAVYQRFIEIFDVDPATTVMVEDMAKNLVPAAALGMTTVWVRTDTTWGGEGADDGHIDHVIDDLSAWLGSLTGGADD